MKTIEIIKQLLDNSITVDMTRMLEPGMPNWPTHPEFKAVVYDTLEGGNGSFFRGITMSEHAGTHIDAGSHFVEGKDSIDQLPVTQVIGRAININVTNTPTRGTVSLKQVKAVEHKLGEIQSGDIVFFYFGWDKKYGKEKYMKDWPGISKEVGEYLVGKKVKAVGCDCLALDPDGTDYPNHEILLGNDINIIENVDKLGELPEKFAVVGLPCKYKGGSGSTLRLVAFLDKDVQEGK